MHLQIYTITVLFANGTLIFGRSDTKHPISVPECVIFLRLDTKYLVFVPERH